MVRYRRCFRIYKNDILNKDMFYMLNEYYSIRLSVLYVFFITTCGSLIIHLLNITLTNNMSIDLFVSDVLGSGYLFQNFTVCMFL